MKRDPRLVRLSWDHHHGLVLALRISREAAGADDVALGALYGDVLAEWSRAVLPHFHAEECCLLARLLRHREGVTAVSETSRDHLEIEALVVDMKDAVDADSRRAAMLAFGERLRSHIRWEESVLFEVSQSVMTGTELDAMAAEVEVLLAPLNAGAPPPG